MRKNSINLYYVNGVDTKEKLDLIKSTGFNEYYTGIYDKNETLTFEEQVEYAKKLGLKCSMVHCSYYEPKLDNFWLDNVDGEEVCNSYLEQIKKCDGVSNNFVVHLNGSKNSTVSEVGLNRIKKLLAECEKYNINLCIENLYSGEEIPYIFQNIKHPNLKICFDVGHKNFLTPNFNLLQSYGKYVTVLHLHDNDGLTDQHNICFTGTVDWNGFAKQIAEHNLILCLEVKLKDKTQYISFINDCYSAIQKLSNLVQKHENNYNL